ncbi:MAG: hypothetical protein ACK56F_07915, partial [bacterium]
AISKSVPCKMLIPILRIPKKDSSGERGVRSIRPFSSSSSFTCSFSFGFSGPHLSLFQYL